MTAEIAILNSSAVALAADSAVTVGRGSSQKVYTGVNKLFSLSERQPVGIMVYGSASMQRVPWETLIKEFRAQLGNKSFPQLKGYADEFLKFLRSYKTTINLPVQRQFLRISFLQTFSSLVHQIVESMNEHLNAHGTIDEVEIKKIIRVKVDDVAKLCALHSHNGFDEKCISDIRKNSTKILNESINESFSKLPLTATSKKKLQKIAVDIIASELSPMSNSGIVISGFGTKETFPALREYSVIGLYENRLLFRELRQGKVSFSNSAGVYSFAQGEMVMAFMDGADPDFRRTLFENLEEIFLTYAEEIPRLIFPKQPRKAKSIEAALTKLGEDTLNKLFDFMEAYQGENFSRPVVEAVSALPKDGLAEMAESLVSLTKLKRRVTLEAETVGGEIDVAVISKSDGFVWVKRKHYFEAELNPRFIANLRTS